MEARDTSDTARGQAPRGADFVVDALRHKQNRLALGPDCRLTEIQDNVYLLSDGGRSYHVKWIPGDDKLGFNEIRMNAEVLRGGAPAPRLAFAVETDGGHVAAWESLPGSDLREHNRAALPEAFAVLGRFHRAHRSRGPVHSNVTDSDYPAIPDMLRAELDFCCAPLPNARSVKPRAAEILAPIESGYPTVVHGDFHPGNIIANAEGIFFLDWAYAHQGVNLLDLDYVESARLAREREELQWWTIGPDEAGPVLSRYFEAAGLGNLDAARVHRAVMLRAQLRAHANARRRGNDEGAAIALRNIHELLGA